MDHCKLAYMVQSVAWYFAWMVNFASEGFILQITLFIYCFSPVATSGIACAGWPM